MMDFVHSLHLEEKLLPSRNVEIIWFYIFFPCFIAYLVLLTDFINRKPSIGMIEIVAPSAFQQLFYPTETHHMEIIAEGLTWCEGPLWVQDEAAGLNYLMFSDTVQNRIFKWEEGKGMFTVGKTIYVEQSGCKNNMSYCDVMYEPGSNGLLRSTATAAAGSSLDILVCQHGERAVSLLRENGTRTELATHFKGKRLNSPNDLVLSPEGHLYFTDPTYGLASKADRKLVGGELDFSGVFMLRGEFLQYSLLTGDTVADQLKLMDDSMDFPNGLAFSPDFSKMYVSNSDPKNAYWKVFDVLDNGLLANGRVFFNATEWYSKQCSSPERATTLDTAITDAAVKVCTGGDAQYSAAARFGAPDGLKVDIHGNLFASGPEGVWVIDPDGKLIARLLVPARAVSNVAFGSDGRLYLTATDIVIRLRVKAKPNRLIATK